MLTIVAALVAMPKDDLDLSSYELVIRTKRLPGAMMEMTSEPSLAKPARTREPAVEQAALDVPFVPSEKQPEMALHVDAEAESEREDASAVLVPLPPPRENLASSANSAPRRRASAGADPLTRKISAFFKVANAFEPRARPDLAR